MPAEAVRAALLRELRVNSLDEVFEWINLEKPLGSASISQVCGSSQSASRGRLLWGPSACLELYGRQASSWLPILGQVYGPALHLQQSTRETPPKRTITSASQSHRCTKPSCVVMRHPGPNGAP